MPQLVNMNSPHSYDIDNNTIASFNVSTRPSHPAPTGDSPDPYIPDEYNVQPYFSSIIACVLLIGIIANTLGIVTFHRARKLFNVRRSKKPSIAPFLIRCLMVTDLIAVLFYFFRGMAYTSYASKWYKCDLDTISNLFFSWMAGFINALLCLERLIALTAPFYYLCNATVGKARVAVGLSLFLALLISLLPAMGFGSYKTQVNGTYYCIGPGDFKANASDYDFEFAVVFLLTGLAILVFIHTCNVIVISKIIGIYRRAKPMRSTLSVESGVADVRSKSSALPSNSRETSIHLTANYEPTSSTTSEGMAGEDGKGRRMASKRAGRPGRTEAAVAKQIIVISVLFTISWLPFYIQRLLKALDVPQPDWYLLVVIFLLVSNHVIDPFVFVFMKKQSRIAFKDLCLSGVCCRRLCPPQANTSENVSSGIQAQSIDRQEKNASTSLTPSTS